jgi:hypothetical protein
MGGGGFGRTSELQTKAVAALIEQAGKLKALFEAPMPGMPAGGNFQDMSEEDRTKMRESMTQRREQQTQIIASIVQEVDRLKGRQLMTEQEESLAPLKEILALAQKEKATETAGKIEALIKARESAFEAKLKALGIDPATLQRGMGGGRRGGAGGGAGGPGGGAGGPGGGGQ